MLCQEVVPSSSFLQIFNYRTFEVYWSRTSADLTESGLIRRSPPNEVAGSNPTQRWAPKRVASEIPKEQSASSSSTAQPFLEHPPGLRPESVDTSGAASRKEERGETSRVARHEATPRVSFLGATAVETIDLTLAKELDEIIEEVDFGKPDDDEPITAEAEIQIDSLFWMTINGPKRLRSKRGGLKSLAETP